MESDMYSDSKDRRARQMTLKAIKEQEEKDKRKKKRRDKTSAKGYIPKDKKLRKSI